MTDDVFAGLDSEREQRSFYLENFSLVVTQTYGNKLRFSPIAPITNFKPHGPILRCFLGSIESLLLYVK